MELLNGFQQVQLGNSGAYVNISNYGLTFNKAVLEMLGRPDYIELFIDNLQKRIAIRASLGSTGIPFCVSKSNSINARVNNKEFARTLFALMEWEYCNISYKTCGEWHEEEKVFIFDLKKAALSNSTNDDFPR